MASARPGSGNNQSLGNLLKWPYLAIWDLHCASPSSYFPAPARCASWTNLLFVFNYAFRLPRTSSKAFRLSSMAQNDAQPVNLGMLKNTLATQSTDYAAQTATLQEQITFYSLSVDLLFAARNPKRSAGWSPAASSSIATIERSLFNQKLLKNGCGAPFTIKSC